VIDGQAVGNNRQPPNPKKNKGFRENKEVFKRANEFIRRIYEAAEFKELK